MSPKLICSNCGKDQETTEIATEVVCLQCQEKINSELDTDNKSEEE